MKVKLLVARVGDGFSQSPKEIIDVDPKEGARLIESQQAVPAGKGTERATRPPTEKRGGKKKAGAK